VWLRKRQDQHDTGEKRAIFLPPQEENDAQQQDESHLSSYEAGGHWGERVADQYK